jgi:hypothetical protein
MYQEIYTLHTKQNTFMKLESEADQTHLPKLHPVTESITVYQLLQLLNFKKLEWMMKGLDAWQKNRRHNKPNAAYFKTDLIQTDQVSNP